MGLLLQADRQLAPAPGDAFVVTDDELAVRAVSQGAEQLFGRSEPSVIHRPLAELLFGVDTDSHGLPELPRLLRAAAAGESEIVETVVVRATGAREHLKATVGACGPPAAALLVIGDRVE
jgi:PAS domain-containing protein